VALALLAGCDTMPEGPTVSAFQGADRNLDEFRTDDTDCKQFSQAQVGGAASASAGRANVVPSEMRGTAVCRAMGAVVGGRGSAASGSMAGSLIDGLEAAQFAGNGLQRRYNCAYVQCMYMKGDKIPHLSGERWPSTKAPWPPDPDAYYPLLSR
jgi:hypothetical protein